MGKHEGIVEVLFVPRWFCGTIGAILAAIGRMGLQRWPWSDRHATDLGSGARGHDHGPQTAIPYTAYRLY